MHNPRSLFFSLPVIGAGTADVESIGSYVQRLSHAHQMKPLALIHCLLDEFPLEERKRLHSGLTYDFLHRNSAVLRQLIERFELATGVDLAPTSVAKLRHLVGTQHLCRRGAPMYCPLCVRETVGDELSHGRLSWELPFVTACANHGVRLRAAEVCKARPELRLSPVQQPVLPSVCRSCGSIGYRCETDIEEASSDEVWVATQAGALLALSSEVLRAMHPDLTRQGVQAVVDTVFSGQHVTASKSARLARACVFTWIKGEGLPTLGPLFKFCLAAQVDVVSLFGGICRQVQPKPRRLDSPELGGVRPTYKRRDWGAIREVVLEAASAETPVSVGFLEKSLGLSNRHLRRMLPTESAALTARVKAAQARQHDKKFEETLEAYRVSAATLAAEGITVSAKRVQARSGLAAFTNNRPRTVALRRVLGEYAEQSENPPTASPRAQT